MSAPLVAPFPYFGGKRRVASEVWRRLGDVASYIEPFCGSAAVLLARPGGAPPAGVETVNDADGLLVNAWRGMAYAPDDVARLADWPVTELDLAARHRDLVRRRPEMAARLAEDPKWCDPEAAAWWIWGASAWLGSGWGAQGNRQIPDVGNTGKGMHSRTAVAAFGGLPEWMRSVAARLAMVRITSGDWHRVLTPCVLTPGARGGGRPWGVYFDPPYGEGAMEYAAGGDGVLADVIAWALAHGDDPRARIAVSCYDGVDLPGWTPHRWRTKGGYANTGAAGNPNQTREVVWFSPHCEGGRQAGLFDAAVTA